MRRFHQIVESLRMGAASLAANTLRGSLTTLGIVIGIVAVVTTMTAINGLKVRFQESVAVLGSDVLYVSRMPWIIQGSNFEYRNRPILTTEVAEQLKGRLKSAMAVNPTTHTFKDLKYRSTVLENRDIVGTTDQHVQVSSAVPESGRFITESEVQFRKFVCVIGSDIRERMFQGQDPLNKKIKIGRYSYRIVGVMEKQGGAGMFGGPNFDAMVYVPITTLLKAYGASRRDFDIAVRALPAASLENLEYEIIGEMRQVRRLKPGEADNFTINKMSSIVDMFDQVMIVVALVGMLITSVSLFVGCIGVMNIMFVSVTERTREIGIRKALGARRSSILLQFLFESATICLLGGVIALAISFGVAKLIRTFLMPASVSPGIVLIAIGVALAAGLAAGIIPAYRASRLHPIEALRYE